MADSFPASIWPKVTCRNSAGSGSSFCALPKISVGVPDPLPGTSKVWR
jgi:hypothetical protein